MILETKDPTHKLHIKDEPGHLEIMLDEFRVRGVIDYEVRKSSAPGRAELTLKIDVKGSEIEI